MDNTWQALHCESELRACLSKGSTKIIFADLFEPSKGPWTIRTKKKADVLKQIVDQALRQERFNFAPELKALGEAPGSGRPEGPR